MVSVPSTARAQTCAPTAQVCLQPVGTIGLTSGGLPVCACAGLYGWGAATEPDGSVLIGDYWNFRIQHYAANGTLLGTAVPPGGHEAPYGIAVDPNDGSIYFGDPDNTPPDVQKYSASGTFLYAITTPKTGAFNYPARVAVASDGTVFVSDMRANVIDVFSNTGTALQTFGSKGSGAGQFDAPRGVAVDTSNNLYVADNYNGRIEEFSESGVFIRQFGSKGTGPGQFGPAADLRGVAIDSSRGFIYVSDKASGYVNQYSLSTGAYTGVRFGGYGTANGKFGDGPREITVDGAGNVWVGDLANFQVQVFSPSGAFLQVHPSPPQPPPIGGFNGGMGVTVDGSGNVWALDRLNQRVEEFNSSGVAMMQFGKRGGGPDGMNYDRAIAYDPNDQTVYVADTDNQAIKKYDLKGNFICQVGVFGTGLGQFNEPQGIDVGSDGTVYVADSLNQRVQVLAPNSCTAVSAFGTKGTNPDGDFEFLRSVEVDPTDGSLWTADQTLGVVEHFTSTGTWLSSFGSSGSAGNQFNQPSDIVLDGNYVLVSDTATNDIKIWTKQGQFVEAYGGFGTALGDFAGPYGMAFAPDGNLYVMEQQNDRIQVLSVSLGGGVGPAAKLAFTQEPSSSNAGAAFPTQPTVAVEDFERQDRDHRQQRRDPGDHRGHGLQRCAVELREQSLERQLGGGCLQQLCDQQSGHRLHADRHRWHAHRGDQHQPQRHQPSNRQPLHGDHSVPRVRYAARNFRDRGQPVRRTRERSDRRPDTTRRDDSGLRQPGSSRRCDGGCGECHRHRADQGNVRHALPRPHE